MKWLYNIIRKTPNIPLDSSFSKVCLVTGPTSGIGLETAKLMYSKGFNVVLACRNVEKGQAVKKFGKEFNRLDVLINNAGIWNGKSEDYKQGITPQGFSVIYQTNYLSHFLLNRLLLPQLINTSKITNKPGRIVNVSSGVHTYVKKEKNKKHMSAGYSLNDLDGWDERMVTEHGDDFSSQALQYMYVKLLQVMYAKQLSRMYPREILSFSCHPGPIASNFFRDWPGWIKFIAKMEVIPPTYGAFTSCYLATSEDPIVLKNSGNYFDNCSLAKHHKLVDDIEQCELLWKKNEEQIAPYLHSGTVDIISS